MSARGWIGVDLDGTIAKYDGWQGEEHIGNPIPSMINKVKDLLKIGYTVKIFTARVSNGDLRNCRAIIQDWTEKHIGTRLDVVCCKDYGMIALYDDRAYRVQHNTGVILDHDT